MTRFVKAALTIFGMVGDSRVAAAPDGADCQFCGFPAAAALPLAWLLSEPAWSIAALK